MPRRKRSENKRPISRKDKLFVQNVAAGATDKAAAMAAGYGQATAENTKARLWSKPEVQAYFRALMQKAAPPERVINKISQHIDGKTVTVKIRTRTVPSSDPARKGEEIEETVMEKTETIDANVSLRALEMAIEIGEYTPPKGTPGVGVGIAITLEQAMIEAGESWQPPSWAKPLPGAEI